MVKFPCSTFAVNIAKQGFTCTFKKKSPDILGVSHFCGEESRKSMQFVLQEKKKASKKSTNYHYNSVHCLF